MRSRRYSPPAEIFSPEPNTILNASSCDAICHPESGAEPAEIFFNSIHSSLALAVLPIHASSFMRTAEEIADVREKLHRGTPSSPAESAGTDAETGLLVLSLACPELAEGIGFAGADFSAEPNEKGSGTNCGISCCGTCVREGAPETVPVPCGRLSPVSDALEAPGSSS